MSYIPNFIFFHLLLVLPIASTQKPGCPTRCGNISIPYPFGVGSDCSLQTSINIACLNASKPFIQIQNKTLEVVEINPTRIRIKYPYIVCGICYDMPSGKPKWSLAQEYTSLSDSQYTFSEDNWLTAIGCDDFLVSHSFAGDGSSFSDSCLSYSVDRSSTSSHCPGNGERNSGGEGCCTTPIRKGRVSWIPAYAFLNPPPKKMSLL